MIGDRLRQAIENLMIEVPGIENPLRITASIGLSLYPDHTNNLTDLIATADHALYEAKRTGRNKCIVAKVPVSADSI